MSYIIALCDGQQVNDDATSLYFGVGMEDFMSAAVRHYEDAGRLLGHGRADNAGHLFGVSGECAIKAVCQDENKQFPLKYFDIKASKDLRHFAAPNLTGRRGQRMLLLLPRIFSGWSIEQRYTTTGTITNAQVGVWKADARAVLNAMQGA